jgi:cytidine deaminase
MNQDYHELIQESVKARIASYAPYSNFTVGAALLARDGTVFTGCNVENASYGLCICAERTAICKAISEGHRDFVAIAISAVPLAPPCGACRQFIVEFGKEITVISVNADNTSECRAWTSGELLPENFEF